MIVIVGKAQVKSDMREAAMTACQAMSAVSEAEEGCISYQFYSSLEDDNLFLLFEQWETADALAKHLAQPHTRQFGAQFPGFLAGALDIKRYEVSSVSDL